MFLRCDYKVLASFGFGLAMALLAGQASDLSGAEVNNQVSNGNSYCYTCGKCAYDCCCPCPQCVPYSTHPGGAPRPADGAAPGAGADNGGVSPEDVDVQAQQQPQAQDFGDVGAAAGTAAGIPGSLGDLGGGTLVLGPLFTSSHAGANIGIAGGDRRFKMIENTSPIPRDRIFFNYNHFHNGLLDANLNDVNMDRYVFGIERTAACMGLSDLVSFELRIPFAYGISSDFVGDLPNQDTEFGDIAITTKGIIYRDCCRVLSAGLSTTLPTGSDASFIDAAGINAVQVENNSYHLQPFIGYAVRHNNRAFSQYLLQWDFDASGYDVLSTAGFSTIKDPALMYASGSWGYWVYRSCCCCDMIQGIAPIAELHYTTTMEDPDVDPTGAVAFRDGRFDLLNLSAGVHLQLRGNSSLRVFAGMPLRSKDNVDFNGTRVFQGDRFFDAEVAVQFNYGY